MREARNEGGLYFFFFQAEDGIRDLTVTGVQTCALPISLKGSRKPAAPDVRAELLDGAADGQQQDARADHDPLPDERADPVTREEAQQQRSEERRVGKEGRSRGTPYN